VTRTRAKEPRTTSKRPTGPRTRQVRLRDHPALQVLTETRPFRWCYAEGPRGAAVDGGTDDPRWLALRQRYEQREIELVSKLAATFKIAEGSPDFWMLLCYCVLGLFPAFDIRQETRGQWMEPERARVIDAVLKAPGKQYVNVLEVAPKVGMKPATLGRRVSERKKRLRPSAE
jgi:hypothetical protein